MIDTSDLTIALVAGVVFGGIALLVKLGLIAALQGIVDLINFLIPAWVWQALGAVVLLAFVLYALTR